MKKKLIIGVSIGFVLALGAVSYAWYKKPQVFGHNALVKATALKNNVDVSFFDNYTHEQVLAVWNGEAGLKA